MKYAFLFYETPDAMAKRDGAPDSAQYWAAWRSYMDLVQQSGAMESGKGLQHPATKTRVSRNGSERVVEDGPFAEGHEELGGFIIVEAADLDAAIALAEQAPCAAPGRGHVELRPCLVPAS